MCIRDSVSTELPEQQVVIDRVMDDVGVYMGAIASGASTDDTRPSLSGTLSAPLRPGQGLQVRVEDVNDPARSFSYRPEVDATGLAWSLEINPALGQGNYRLMAGVVNAGGAMGPRHADFNLRINNLTFSELEDAAGPITGNVFAGAEPFLTDDKIPVLRGQLGTALGEGEALRIVSVHGGKETLLGLATLAPRGQGGFTWQLVLGASPDGGGELPDGHSTLSARVVDAASGQIRLAVDRVIDVDAGTPTGLANISEVRDQIPGNNGFVGVLAGNQSTDDRRPLISGMLAGAKTLPGSRAVQIVDSVKRPDGTVAENVLGLATLNTARNDGSWSFTPQESLALGDHTFSDVYKRQGGERPEAVFHSDVFTKGKSRSRASGPARQGKSAFTQRLLQSLGDGLGEVLEHRALARLDVHGGGHARPQPDLFGGMALELRFPDQDAHAVVMLSLIHIWRTSLHARPRGYRPTP